MYQPVVCGGDNKLRDTIIHKLAQQRTFRDMESAPCGCDVCHANSLLFNLYQERIHAGVNPYSGRSV